MRRPWLLVLLMIAAATCAKTNKTYIVLSVQGTLPRPVHSLDVALVLGSSTDEATFTAPAGGSITLPTTAALEIGSGTGDLEVSVRALDDAGALLGTGSARGTVVAGQTASIPVLLTPAIADAGVDAQATPDASSAANDADGLDAPTTEGGGADLAGDATTASGGADGSDARFGAGGASGGNTGAGGATIDALAGGGAGGLALDAAAGGTPSAGGATAGASGTGYHLTISPPALDFGTVAAGSASAPQALTISNTGDQSSPALAVSVNDLRHFPIYQDRCGGTQLGPGLTCVVAFTFVPDAAGSFQTQGAVTPGQGQPSPFALSGRSGSNTAQISMSPNSVDFSVRDVGMSGTMDFTVTSTGAAAPGSVTIGLSGSPEFSLVNNACASVSLAPSGRCTFTLLWVPTTFGPAQATIDATTTSGAGATSFASGTGRDYVQVSVDFAGKGSGTVSGSGLNCRPGNPCTVAIARTDPANLPTVVLDAAPDATSIFAGWSGACTGIKSCSLVMDGSKNVTAAFAGVPTPAPTGP